MRKGLEARIAELKAETAKKANVTRESLVARLQHLSALADANGQVSAAISVEKEIGILTGHRVEKSAVEQHTSDLDGLTDAELARIAREGVAKAPPPKPSKDMH